jgi:hypothetical protein
LELYEPPRSTRYFHFYEEPLINEVRNTEGTYEFVDPDVLDYISWSGPENITYIKGSAGSNSANNLDYIEIDDNFKFSYRIPKIIPGQYNVLIRFDAYNENNATIRVYLDNSKIGGNISLTGGGSSNNPFKLFSIGAVEFTENTEHLLEINSLIPGMMKIDYVQFTPLK